MNEKPAKANQLKHRNAQPYSFRPGIWLLSPSSMMCLFHSHQRREKKQQISGHSNSCPLIFNCVLLWTVQNIRSILPSKLRFFFVYFCNHTRNVYKCAVYVFCMNGILEAGKKGRVKSIFYQFIAISFNNAILEWMPLIVLFISINDEEIASHSASFVINRMVWFFSLSSMWSVGDVSPMRVHFECIIVVLNSIYQTLMWMEAALSWCLES